MRFGHCLLSALLIVPASTCTTRADAPLAGPRASWEEPGAEVEVFSPDGRTLVTSQRVGRGVLTQLRDAATGRVRADLVRPGMGFYERFSPDGRLLFAIASSDRDGSPTGLDLKVWVVATGEPYATFPYVSEGLNFATGGFALSRDGTTLAFTDNSERLPVQMKTLKFLMDGRYETTFSYNANPGLPRLVIWDVGTWKKTATIDAGPPMVFSPDGKTLVTGSRDWKVPVVKVWDTATWTHSADLVGKSQGMKPMTFSPDGKLLAIGGYKNHTLWELSTGESWPLAVGRHDFGAPVFSPDGRVLFPVGMPRPGKPAFNDRELPSYDLAAPPPRKLELGNGGLIVSPDARRYAVVHGGSYWNGPSLITFHDLPGQRESGRLAVETLGAAGFSPDGRWLAILVYRHEPGLAGAEGRMVRAIRLLDPATARVLVTIPTAYPTAWNDPTWMFSPDMKTLAITYWKGIDEGDDSRERPMTVDLWDLPEP